MSTNESLAKVQALYDRYTGILNTKKDLIQKRDTAMVQVKMAEEQLQGIYGPNWKNGYEKDLEFFTGLEQALTAAVPPVTGAS